MGKDSVSMKQLVRFFHECVRSPALVLASAVLPEGLDRIFAYRRYVGCLGWDQRFRSHQSRAWIGRVLRRAAQRQERLNAIYMTRHLTYMARCRERAVNYQRLIRKLVVCWAVLHGVHHLELAFLEGAPRVANSLNAVSDQISERLNQSSQNLIERLH
jgi:hypothetical protein